MYSWGPAVTPPPPHLAFILLVSQDTRHLFVSSCILLTINPSYFDAVWGGEDPVPPLPPTHAGRLEQFFCSSSLYIPDNLQKVKGTVQRHRSSWNWPPLIDLYWRERRGDFQQMSPPPPPILWESFKIRNLIAIGTHSSIWSFCLKLYEDWQRRDEEIWNPLPMVQLLLCLSLFIFQ